ncbi:hypothetical protein AUJ38_03370 [bacterium CG1_02_42_9]|nr:MAG: hypothetical protein AUJ38_03370 [bacterium CG1_02_42_9]
MAKKITKAVIALAGFGTRFLPATKAQPKEMLPIIDKPIVQYLVEEAVDSGITVIILVTRHGSRALEDHFDSSPELENLLEAQGKTKYLEMVRKISTMANFVYVGQKKHMPYGNATPILCAKPLIDNDEAFVYMYGDDLVKAEVPCTKQLIDIFEKTGCAAINAVQEMPEDVLYRYGIVKYKEHKEGGVPNQLEYFVEKPEPGKAPSKMASFGRFVFSYQIFDFLSPEAVGKGNELWVVDAITKLAKDHVVLAQPIEGKWLTTGDPLNYLKATVEYALDHPEIKGAFREYLKTIS